MQNDHVIKWLLEGDVAIQFQVHRDLLGKILPELQQRIKSEGWGRAFLEKRNPDGGWGRAYYQPKWISTHYTLLDLKNLQIDPNLSEIRQTLNLVLKTEKKPRWRHFAHRDDQVERCLRQRDVLEFCLLFPRK